MPSRLQNRYRNMDRGPSGPRRHRLRRPTPRSRRVEKCAGSRSNRNSNCRESLGDDGSNAYGHQCEAGLRAYRESITRSCTVESQTHASPCIPSRAALADSSRPSRRDATAGRMPGMSEERKRAVWPWIAAQIIGLPVLYVASFGPACWVMSQVDVGGWVEPHSAMRIYSPLGKIAYNEHTESQCGQWLRWWMTVGLRDGHSVIVPTAPHGFASPVVGGR